MGQTTRTLVAANRAVHEELEEAVLVVYEALTALDLPEARASFDRFLERLEAHMRFEDEHMLPALARVLAERSDDSTLYKQVDGDHRILERTRDKVLAAFGRLEQDGSRRAMVLELDTFLLLRRVLEHHSEREHRFAYPLLDEHLDENARARLLAGLR